VRPEATAAGTAGELSDVVGVTHSESGTDLAGIQHMNAASRMTRESSLTCPECGHVTTETMPADACQWFYECEQCSVILRPKPGDCCVFCSYGTVSCPPKVLGALRSGQ
jgi:hypothetical protein